MSDTALAYPIGRFEMPVLVDAEMRRGYIVEIEMAPRALREAVTGLSDPQLDAPYRPGGWTVRQVVHHIPDSHVNAYVRFKLALTETEPTIKPYDEVRWAELPDALKAPVELSLTFLESVHARWVACMRGIPPEFFHRCFRHPVLGVMSLDQQLAMYSWHGRHHVAHIVGLVDRRGWKSRDDA